MTGSAMNIYLTRKTEEQVKDLLRWKVADTQSEVFRRAVDAYYAAAKSQMGIIPKLTCLSCGSEYSARLQGCPNCLSVRMKECAKKEAVKQMQSEPYAHTYIVKSGQGQ